MSETRRIGDHDLKLELNPLPLKLQLLQLVLNTDSASFILARWPPAMRIKRKTRVEREDVGEGRRKGKKKQKRQRDGTCIQDIFHEVVEC